MGNTSISWTQKTWNPVSGCTKISDGCKFCYAERIADRFWKDRKFTDIQCHEDRLDQPLHWKKPSMIFVNSMSDLFHEKVPLTFIDKILSITCHCPQHIFQILTKRPERMLQLIRDEYNWKDYEKFGEKMYQNIWFGVSVENQKTADERIPLLLQVPAKVRFVSYEPALEEIDIFKYLYHDSEFCSCAGDIDYCPHNGNKLDWVIAGCESGIKRRKAKELWFTVIKHHCHRFNIAFFMKQMEVNGKVTEDMSKFPIDLQVREYPQ